MNSRTQISGIPFKAWFICALGALFYGYEYYLRIAPSVMTQELMQVFRLSATGLGTLTGFYYYAYTPMQLPVGLLLDRYSPRILLVGACLSCTLGSLLFVQYHHLWIAELGRFMIGFGSAFAFVGALKLATLWLPPNRFAMISGLTTALGMFGAIIGDVSLTYLVECCGWQFTIIAPAFFGFLLAGLLWWCAEDKKTHKKSGEIQSYSTVIKGMRWALGSPILWVNGIMGCLLFLPLTSFAEMWGIHYLKHIYHLSNHDAALANSLTFLGWAIGAPTMGFLSDFFKRRRLFLSMGALMGAICVSLLIYWPHSSKSMIFFLLFASGICCSAEIIIFPLAKEITPRALAGTALAITNMFVMFGGIFQTLIGVMLDWHWSGKLYHGIRVYSPENYQFALSIIPLGLLFAFVLSWFLPETKAKQTQRSVKQVIAE